VLTAKLEGDSLKAATIILAAFKLSGDMCAVPDPI
jgi:hypothetical protein